MTDDGGSGQGSGGGSGQKWSDSGNVIKVDQQETDQKLLVMHRKEIKLLLRLSHLMPVFDHLSLLCTVFPTPIATFP